MHFQSETPLEDVRASTMILIFISFITWYLFPHINITLTSKLDLTPVTLELSCWDSATIPRGHELFSWNAPESWFYNIFFSYLKSFKGKIWFIWKMKVISSYRNWLLIIMIYFFFIFRIRQWPDQKIKTVFQCKSNWRIRETFRHNQLSWYTNKTTTCNKNESFREPDSGNLFELQFTTKTFKRKPHEWSSILKQLVNNSRRIVWVFLTILRSWRLKN